MKTEYTTHLCVGGVTGLIASVILYLVFTYTSPVRYPPPYRELVANYEYAVLYDTANQENASNTLACVISYGLAIYGNTDEIEHYRSLTCEAFDAYVAGEERIEDAKMELEFKKLAFKHGMDVSSQCDQTK